MLCFASIGPAQENAPTTNPQNGGSPGLVQRPAPSPNGMKGAVRLDVLVTDAAGQTVAGLTRKDFTLLENGKPQPMLSFRAIDGTKGDGTRDEPPVEVILLVDEANSVAVNIANERYQIERFLRQNEGHLAQPTTLMVYSDQGVQAQPRPTMDGNALAETFDKISMSTHMIPLTGGYDAIERLQRSLKALRLVAAVEARKPGKKMLIWIGPGWPMLEGPAYRQSDSSQKAGFNTVVEITSLLREARITLYNINAFDPASAQGVRTDFYKSFLKPARSVHEMETGDLAVPVFAVHTGGSVFRTGGDVAVLLNRCIAEAKAYYRVGFDPAAGARTDEYREIAVRPGLLGLTARTITGYYVEPGLKR